MDMPIEKKYGRTFQQLLIRVAVLATGLCVVLSACRKKEGDKEADTMLVGDTELRYTGILMVENKLFSIPSPFQAATLLQRTDSGYRRELLNPRENAGKYLTNFKKALNAGTYGANLGYLISYNEQGLANDYLRIFISLLKDLGIKADLGEDAIEDIIEQKVSKDSLRRSVAEVYTQASKSLQESDLNEITTLIVAGGWIESLHFLTQASLENPHSDLMTRIADQQEPLNNLIAIMRPYYNRVSADYDRLLMRLINLAYLFDGITIDYQYVPPVTNATKKITTLRSKSVVYIEEVHLTAIADSIEHIRKEIIE